MSSKNIGRAKIFVEQKRSSKNIWSSKNGRAKIFVEQKYRSSKNICRAKISVEQKYLSSKSLCKPSRRSVLQDGPMGRSMKQKHNKINDLSTLFFARTILLMNLFTQFWLSGGRHVGSPWDAILLVIWGAPFCVSVGYHYGSAGGDIIILVRIITKLVGDIIILVRIILVRIITRWTHHTNQDHY